jgi:hypothetical protein
LASIQEKQLARNMSSSSNNKDSGRDNTLAAVTAAGVLGIAAGMICYSLCNLDSENKEKRRLFKKMKQYDKSLLKDLT